MKRIGPSRARAGAFLAISLSVALAPADRVRADEPPFAVSKIEAGATFGRFYGGNLANGTTALFDRKAGVDDDQLQGFWVAARIPHDWTIEAAVRRTRTAIVEPSGGLFPNAPELGRLDVASIETVATHAFPIGRLAPYIGGGAGLVNLDIDVPDRAQRDSNRGAVAVTTGLRFDALSFLAFRFDLRSRATYLGRRRSGTDDGWRDSGRWFVNHEITFGIAAVFGE